MSHKMSHYASVGYLCELFQESPDRIEIALIALGVQPAYMQNGIVFYDATKLTASAMADALGWNSEVEQ